MARASRTLEQIDALIADVTTDMRAVNWSHWGARSRHSYLSRRQEKLQRERRALLDKPPEREPWDVP